MKRVGIYIRVSTEEQARIQDGSLVSQKIVCLSTSSFKTNVNLIGVPETKI